MACGTMYSVLTYDPLQYGLFNGWLIRIDPAGNKIWEQTLATTNFQSLDSLKRTTDGGFILGGWAGSSLVSKEGMVNGNRSISYVFSGRDFWMVRLGPEDDCDGDGIPDSCDLCPNTPPGVVVNENGCSIDQLCPCDGAWKNHGKYVEAIEKTASHFLKHGWITKATERAIVERAEKSDCGRRGSRGTEPPSQPDEP
jgi:hypothetical protein